MVITLMQSLLFACIFNSWNEFVRIFFNLDSAHLSQCRPLSLAFKQKPMTLFSFFWHGPECDNKLICSMSSASHLKIKEKEKWPFKVLRSSIRFLDITFISKINWINKFKFSFTNVCRLNIFNWKFPDSNGILMPN